MSLLVQNLGATALVLVACAVLQIQSLPSESASCGDLRDSGNQLACTKVAYRAWLAAGRDSSDMDASCHEDLLELPKKCNMTSYLEEGLKLSEQKVGEPYLTALKDFITPYFVELYREAHPDEPALHLGTRADGNDCCKSEDGEPDEEIVQNLLEFHVGLLLSKHRENPDKVPREDVEEAVARCLSKHILRPCGRYLDTMDELLFGQLTGSVKKFMNDDWSFLSGQSKEFRDAVFRYQWCSKPDLNARVWEDDD